MKPLSRRSVTTGLAAAVTALPVVGLCAGIQSNAPADPIQDWIDAAIACGRDPRACIQADGRQWLYVGCVDVDWERNPGHSPEPTAEVIDRLIDMGRVWPPEVTA